MSYTDKNIGRSKMKEQPSRPLVFKLKDKTVTPSNLSDSVKSEVIAPMIDTLDRKYEDITNDLYRMIETIHGGGVVLVNGLGNKETVGISQKGITSLITRLWDKISEITGEDYSIGYTMTVEPTSVVTKETIHIDVTVDSKESICIFDRVKIYANDILKVDVKDVDKYTTTFDVNETSIIKCEATMAEQTIVKEAVVTKEYPFFMGSGRVYTEILIPECSQPFDGSLEGSYDVEVRNNNDHLFIIITRDKDSEFRRADMNGYEIPMTKSYVEDLIVFKSVNTYDRGTYNIDIDINS